MASSMNPNFINLSLSLFPHDQHQQLQLSLAQDSSSSSSSLSLQPNLLNLPLQEYHQETYNPLPQDTKELDSLVSLGPSIEDRPVIVENQAPHGLKISLWKRGDKDGHGSNKWVPSKIRLMGRMVGTNRTESQSGKNVAKAKLIEGDQKSRRSSNSIESDHSLINNNITTPIRVCADCNTTKTPLWRSGPRGPKSLCNACGIRQRKARRAMAMAAAAATAANCEVANSSVVKTTKKTQNKEKRPKDVHILPYKKRCTRIVSSPTDDDCVDDHQDDHGGIKNPCFEDFYINLSKNLAFHRVFPQDEKEAAILLMALSCGLVHG